jgi:AcrR family transcriptional regulator
MARPADPHRREEILQAATAVFIEQGYSEARLADIAKRARVVVSTLYLYFDSKEAMVRAIAKHIRQELLDQVYPVIEHLTSQADIEQLVEIMASFAISHQDQLRILHLDSALRDVHTRENIKNVGHRQGSRVQRLIHAFEQQRDRGFLYPYDPAFVVEILLNFLRWFVTTYSLLEEEEAATFKVVGVQWLCHALLSPTEETIPGAGDSLALPEP